MLRETLRCAAPAAALALIVLLPFGGKAFTIDDTLFLQQATHLLADPLHPTAFTTVWSEAAVPQRMSQIMPSGPVAAWVLVPSALAGGSEWLAHLAQLAMLLVALVATVAFALRLGMAPRGATIAGLLLAATPAALAMAGTAMPDVPAMALGVAGLERLVAWKQHRRLHQGIAAAVLLGLAPLARSHVLLLLGMGALLVAEDYLARASWRNERFTAWLPILSAPLLTAVVVLITRDPEHGGGDLARSAQTFSDLTHVAANTVAFATHLVLAVPLAVPWFVARSLPIVRRWWVLAAATAGISVALFASPWTRWPVLVGLVAVIGIATLFDVFADAWDRRDSFQLTLGLWLLAPLPIVIYLHMPSKYLLASAPAAALLVARSLERVSKIAQWTAMSTIVLGVALGVGILRADAAFAGLGRRAAADLIAPNVASGHRVWFAGHWGFQWYAENAGGRILTLTPPYPVAGDLIVTSRNSEPGFAILQMLAERYPTVSHLTRIEDREAGGRIMNARLGAGFFSNGWGYLPWAWGDDPLDTFDLWQIHSDTEAATR
jgi:hypothetical protein